MNKSDDPQLKGRTRPSRTVRRPRRYATNIKDEDKVNEPISINKVINEDNNDIIESLRGNSDDESVNVSIQEQELSFKHRKAETTFDKLLDDDPFANIVDNKKERGKKKVEKGLFDSTVNLESSNIFNSPVNAKPVLPGMNTIDGSNVQSPPSVYLSANSNNSNSNTETSDLNSPGLFSSLCKDDSQLVKVNKKKIQAKRKMEPKVIIPRDRVFSEKSLTETKKFFPGADVTTSTENSPVLTSNPDNLDLLKEPSLLGEPSPVGLRPGLVTSTPMIVKDKTSKKPEKKINFDLDIVEDSENVDPNISVSPSVIESSVTSEDKMSVLKPKVKTVGFQSDLKDDDSELMHEPSEEDLVMIPAKGGKNWRRTVFLRRKSSVAVKNVRMSNIRETTEANPGLINRSFNSGIEALNRLSLAVRRRTMAIISKKPESESVEPRKAPPTSRRATVFLAPKSKDYLLKPDEKTINSSHNRSNFVEVNEEDNKVEVSILASDELTFEEKVLKQCTKQEIVAFSGLYPEDVLSSAKKVGEGSFGEVFLMPGLGTKIVAPPVLKIVPVDGTIDINDGPQTLLSNMLAEIVVSKELSRLGDSGRAPNFVKVVDVYLAQGVYPPHLLEAWDAYDAQKVGGSENERPDEDKLGAEQKFLALVFGNGGRDLEATTDLSGAARGLSIFHQVVHTLAVAESEYNFEHRDLHWGNILIQSTSEKSVDYVLKGQTFKVKTEKVKATLIDFSLSRMRSKDNNSVIFYDLGKDPDLFKAQGDYQFDIYRMMRDHVDEDWQGFHPKTNIFWLHYLLDKLIEEVPYKNKSTKLHANSMDELMSLRDRILEFDSATQFVEENGKK